MTRGAEVRAHLDTAQYEAALGALREGLREAPGSPELLDLAHELARRLERWCEELGSSKTTEYLPATQRYAELLEKARALLAER